MSTTKNRNAVIFGASGQDGAYLSALLERNGIAVTGISRKDTRFRTGDVADIRFTEEIIRAYRPAYIFHLAANSTTRHDAVLQNYEVISTGTLNILESVLRFSKDSRVFISGSGLQFANNGEPINELSPFEVRDAYSMARIQSVYAARYYRRLGLKVFTGYFFNHDSPLRAERHINQKIIKAAAEIAGGAMQKLRLGDITVKKEFGFAGDVVEAVWKLVNNETIFEAVIGTGQAHEIADWLDLCFRYHHLNWQDHVEMIPDFLPEYRILVSDPAVIRSLSWQHTVDMGQLCRIMSDSYCKK